ncbi:hypothetical protein [Sphingomonas immobilis]|uniref:UrcA family protein n=1 Tax=Sphingomonas immobilis TaxID=3063997 RepID=A0ABT9A404_9SPHN|nr:hypothetical protein [Sphingomonas sp. CA1-15]MDO7844576.1 hypothetical protein [Sphingomonas sp. CA1-15]
MKAALALALTFVAADPAAARAPLPATVRHFIARRDECDHFRGEVEYDKARAAEMAAAFAKYCKGSDADLARIRRQYRHNRLVLKAVSGYETRIE